MLKISHRLQGMSYSQTLSMASKARDLRSQGYDIINLSIGEPDFIPPKFILNSAKKAIDNGYHYYTPVSGYQELREVICKKFKRDNNLNYNPSQIVVSTGVKQSIINILLTLLNPGDELIIPAPYWVSYYEMAKLCEAKPVIINTDIKTNFKITAEQLEKVITSKTKAFIFSSPCNPSGSIYSKNELKKLVKVFEKYPNIIIISDEIYEHIRYSNIKHTSIASFSEVYDQTVTINGLSKAFSMTGWRIGYIGAPEWLAKSCDKIQGQTTSGPNSIAQYAAITALNYHPKSINYMINAFEKRRNLVLKLISGIYGFKYNYPEGAFYIFPDISFFFGKKLYGYNIKSSEDFAMYILNKAHVAIVGGSAFGNSNCIRISYAVSEKILEQAFQRIYKVIN